MKGLSTAKVGATPLVEAVGAIPLGEAVIDSSMIISLPDLVGTETETDTKTETGRVGDTVVEVEAEVEVEKNSDEMLVERDDAVVLTSTIKTLPSSTSFPILTSNSIPNSNSKRKRITPTVVSSLVSQPYIGNMLSSTNNTATNNNNSSTNYSSSDVDNGSNDNEKMIKSKIGDNSKRENSDSNAILTEPSSLSVHTVAVTKELSHLASSNSNDSSIDPGGLQPVKPLGIVFPLIPSTITTSNSSTTGGMEIKKV